MSESHQSSSSSFGPVVPPQEIITQNILNSIAGVATNYANQLFSWGQGVFNGLSGDISGLMGKLDQAATTAMTGANQAMDQFSKGFVPDYNALRTEAGQYANPARQARNAGMAESDQMQGNRSAMNNALQKLEGMGVDTSSGRYAHDLLSGETAGAAAAAGAGTQSIRADEATALGLKKQALDYGIQMPGIAANFLNQANSANSISGNLDIGKTNAGTAIMSLPNAYLNTAMQDRYPPMGNQGGQSSQSSTSRPSSSAGGGNPNGLSNEFTPSPSSWSGMTHGTPGDPNAGGGGGGSNWSAMSTPTIWANKDGTDLTGPGPTDTGGSDWYSQQTPFNQYNGVGDYSGYSGNDYNTNNFASNFNPNASYNDTYYNTSPVSSYDIGQNNTYYDQSATQEDPGMSDYSGGFAGGGAIPDGSTTGGYVPQSASPSQGQQTDDIHASLNADEFVVPRDVSLWKGQEFFQKLIAQSRKNLATAGAKGKPAPAPQGPVRFASRPMGA